MALALATAWKGNLEPLSPKGWLACCPSPPFFKCKPALLQGGWISLKIGCVWHTFQPWKVVSGVHPAGRAPITHNNNFEKNYDASRSSIERYDPREPQVNPSIWWKLDILRLSSHLLTQRKPRHRIECLSSKSEWIHIKKERKLEWRSVQFASEAPLVLKFTESCHGGVSVDIRCSVVDTCGAPAWSWHVAPLSSQGGIWITAQLHKEWLRPLFSSLGHRCGIAVAKAGRHICANPWPQKILKRDTALDRRPHVGFNNTSRQIGEGGELSLCPSAAEITVRK